LVRGGRKVFSYDCATVGIIACSTTLEGVAKGWCDTTRASQSHPCLPIAETGAPPAMYHAFRRPWNRRRQCIGGTDSLALDDNCTRYGHYLIQILFDGYWKENGARLHTILTTRPNAAKSLLNGAVSQPSQAAIRAESRISHLLIRRTSGFGLALAQTIMACPSD